MSFSNISFGLNNADGQSKNIITDSPSLATSKCMLVIPEKIANATLTYLVFWSWSTWVHEINGGLINVIPLDWFGKDSWFFFLESLLNGKFSSHAGSSIPNSLIDEALGSLIDEALGSGLKKNYK